MLLLIRSTILVVILLIASTALAQWPDNPDSNMVICDRTGAQVIAKVATTSDGGCYVCWYDNSSGNYDVYLQRLNGQGVIQWIESGLLISDNPQQTWLTDYSMIVDNDDNAIIVFNDSRAGADWDIYAYKISPSGDFLWGEDGITVSDNDGFEPFPQVMLTSASNFVIAWQEDNVVHMRKLTPDGSDYWSDPSVITLTSEYGTTIPRVAPAENDGVILQALVAAGPNYWDPKHIYAYKFDASGAALWGNNGVAISTAGGIGIQVFPSITDDHAGGAYSYWYDSRSGNHHVYVQHVLSNGAIDWTANGVQASLASGEMQMNPTLTKLPGTDDILVFYKLSNLSQSLIGIGGQRLNSAGVRQWGNNGVTLAPLEDRSRWDIQAYAQPDGAIVVYFDTPVGNYMNALVTAMRVDENGGQVWPVSPIEICTFLDEKVHLDASVNLEGQVIAVWEDKRNDESADIYLQNVNPDGSLGEYSTAYEYLPGDVNMPMGIWPPQVIGGDVTYLVGYFRGGRPVCLLDGFWASADANGDCNIIGSDVTRLVNYFRGNTTLEYCPDYEPAWLTPDDLPDEAPEGWPNCEDVELNSKINIIPVGIDK